MLILACSLISATAQMVTFYQDCNYRGYSVTLSPGYYNSRQHGMRVRDLSSLTIPDGVVVNLFAEDNFNGHFISLTRSSSCLINERFNDMMVSLQILNTGYGFNNQEAPVIVYNRCNFQGRPEPLGEGNYSLTTLGLMTAQSIRVAPGYAVIFRKERRNGGATFVSNEEFRENNNCLAPLWGSTVKSAFVYRLSNMSSGYWDHSNQNLSHFTEGAVAYSDINFGGKGQALSPGAYRSYQLYYVGERNISSIRIAPGYRAIAFEGENFTGANIEIRNGVANLHQSYWGNRIGSIVIERMNGGVIINPSQPPPPPPPPPTVVSIPANTPMDKVTVYSQSYFRGGSYSFATGSYRGNQLYVVGERNISSLVVPHGYTATVFTGSNFDGQSRVISTSINDLLSDGQGWNKRISSMIIQRVGQPVGPNPPSRPQPDASSILVTAYADANFMGAAQVFGPGRYMSYQLSGVGIRTISSIKVPPGYRVTVYDGPNLNGDFRVLTYTIDNFVTEGQGHWNDRISSMLVERIR